MAIEEGIEGEASHGLKRKTSSDGRGWEQQAVSARKVAKSELSGLLSALHAGPRNAYVAKKSEEKPIIPLQQVQKSRTVTHADGQGKMEALKVGASSASGPSTSHSRPAALLKPSQAASSPQSNGKDSLVPPTIPRISHPGSSPVPYSSRQTSLRTLFNTFYSLYSPLAPRGPISAATEAEKDAHQVLYHLAHHLACQDSISSESKIFKNSNVNFLAYRNSIRTNLVGLARRQKADKETEESGKGECMSMLGIQATEAACHIDEETELTLSSRESEIKEMEQLITKMLQGSILIGTNDEVNEKIKKQDERLKGSLDKSRLEAAKLVTELDVLESVGYPLPDSSKTTEDLQAAITECWGEGGRERDLIGSELVCDRCGVEFKVASLGPEDQEAREACSFHWGKRLDEATTFASNSLSQIAASAGLVESSNGQSNAPKGCTRGPHVFKEEKPESLHKREGFLSTEQVCSDLIHSKDGTSKYDVLAFDCELVYTTAGMSLARLTVLDESGKVTLDQYVKPRAAVLDYNTRFSGINVGDLQEKESVVDLDEARRKMVAMMTPSTILVGHGLENDLKALRLVHLKVADSALLYRHHKGLPYRFSLRDLTLKHLGKHIQSGDATLGHDPEEDARSALDLVRLKYRDYAENPAGQSKAPTQLITNNHHKSASSIVGLSPSPGTQPPSPSASSTKKNFIASSSSGPSEAAKASLFMKPRQPMRKKAK
ncbi:hypothetical protein CBS101457_002056 [Exobasidium rhododendri]|nr:hypothetical protein CBS101457_002056 [Exobasidium rhododendri]